MPNTTWEKIKSVFRTEKQSKRMERVETAVTQRKQATLELERAIKDLANARAGKRNGAV